MTVIETTFYHPKPYDTRTSTEAIIQHHAAASQCTIDDIQSWHMNMGFNGFGYHIFVRKNGLVYRGRPIWASGAQCLGWNYRTIGVCAEGNYEVDTDMPEAQRQALAEVYALIRETYGNIPVLKHSDKVATACPGRYFPFSDVTGRSVKQEIPYPGYLIRYNPNKYDSNVKLIQEKLGVGVDGYFGNNTKNAVIKFQTANKLLVDGIVGKNTWNALFN